MTTTFTVMPQRPISEDMFADLGYPHVDFEALADGGVQVTVAADLTPSQVARAKARLMGATADDEAVMWAAYQGWKSNKDFLAVSSPTTAQIVSQVQTLTRQVNKVLQYLMPDAASQ